MVSARAKQIINSTKTKVVKVPRGATPLGSAGYDNPRDDIEKTKSLRELSLPFTKGSVVFQGDNLLTEDNFNLFWDDATNELQPHLLKIVDDGSQASPALKFNDTNTGFFKSGDSVSFSLNNSTIMTMDATGLDMNTHKIVGVVDPTDDQDAATKKFVLDNAGGIALTDVYPIGSIYLSTSSTNPNTTFGFGTWSRVGAGRYIIDAPSGDAGATSTGTALTNAENRAVGQHTHTFTGDAMSDHGHAEPEISGTWLKDGSGGISLSGGGARSLEDINTFMGSIPGASAGTPTGTNANSGSVAGTNAPYISIFMWKRTA